MVEKRTDNIFHVFFQNINLLLYLNCFDIADNKLIISAAENKYIASLKAAKPSKLSHDLKRSGDKPNTFKFTQEPSKNSNLSLT